MAELLGAAVARAVGFLGVLQGHSGTVYSASFSPDGQKVVSISDDKTVQLYRYELVDRLPHRSNRAFGLSIDASRRLEIFQRPKIPLKKSLFSPAPSLLGSLP